MKTTAVKPTNRLANLPKNGNGDKPSLAITLPALRTRTIELNVQGKTPLIFHAWSSKAVKMMLDKQMGIASAGREKKDPFKDFEESLYRLQDGRGFGFPAPGFKACAVSAANAVELKMTQMKQAIHVNWYTIPIDAPPLADEHRTEWDEKYSAQLKPYHAKGVGMRMDLVRLESGVADIRFRGWMPVWSAKLEIEFNESVVTTEQVVNLFNAAGYGVGVGEWRPGAPECRSGEFGRFSVK